MKQEWRMELRQERKEWEEVTESEPKRKGWEEVTESEPERKVLRRGMRQRTGQKVRILEETGIRQAMEKRCPETAKRQQAAGKLQEMVQKPPDREPGRAQKGLRARE